MKITQMIPLALIDSNQEDFLSMSEGVAAHTKECLTTKTIKSVQFQLNRNQFIVNNEIYSDNDDSDEQYFPQQQWCTEDNRDDNNQLNLILDHPHPRTTSRSSIIQGKTVRFDLESIEYIGSSDNNNDDEDSLSSTSSSNERIYQDCWYDEHDYERFKSFLRRDARIVQCQNKYQPYREIIKDMFAACYKSSSHDNNDDDDDGFLCKTTNHPTYPLLMNIFHDQIHNHGTMTLGLDKHCIKSLVVSRQLRRRELYFFVQTLQEEGGEDNTMNEVVEEEEEEENSNIPCQNQSQSYSSSSDLDMILREGCEDITQPNSLFAQWMGQAIARSVLLDQQQ